MYTVTSLVNGFVLFAYAMAIQLTVGADKGSSVRSSEGIVLGSLLSQNEKQDKKMEVAKDVMSEAVQISSLHTWVQTRESWKDRS
jgi:hypothetical protein